jgi:hypothetical protein
MSKFEEILKEGRERVDLFILSSLSDNFNENQNSSNK